MVASYIIFGKKVPSHYLAIGTLSTVVGGILWATQGSKKEAKEPAPAAPAPAEGEDDIMKSINDFVKSTETEDAK